MTAARRKRRDSIQRRVEEARPVYAVCAVLDCGRPSAAQEKSGLHKVYCRHHAEHFRRHGSYSKPSYTAAELNGYRVGALRWLQTHADLPEVAQAVEKVRTLYWRGGKPEEAFRLVGKSPEQRALMIWAWLRVREVDPLVPIAAWLAVQLRHQADHQPERRIEFRWVQVAKVLHRIAGGSHKRWQLHNPDGSLRGEEVHRYPASRGRVLRHLGEALAEAAKPLEAHLEAIKAICGARGEAVRLPKVRKRRT